VEDAAIIRRDAVCIEEQAFLESFKAGNGSGELDAVCQEVRE
jgi:hypothetical protein